MVPGTSITIREGCVPVRASHGKRVTYERLNADLYSWEYKGGACKSVNGRVMFKPCMCCMHHVLHFLLAQDAPLHLDILVSFALAEQCCYCYYSHKVTPDIDRVTQLRDCGQKVTQNILCDCIKIR